MMVPYQAEPAPVTVTVPLPLPFFPIELHVVPWTVPPSAMVSVPVPSRPTSTTPANCQSEPAPVTVAVPLLPEASPI